MSRLARHTVWIAAAALMISAGTAAALPLLSKAQIVKAAAKVEACLDKQYQTNGGSAEKCVGTVKAACDDKISAGGEAAHATCSDDETAVWDVLLNKAWALMPDDLGPARFAVLKDVQKQWLAYREAKCKFLNDLERPGAWGIMLEADCRMDETARRTIELREILADPNIGLPE